MSKNAGLIPIFWLGSVNKVDQPNKIFLVNFAKRPYPLRDDMICAEIVNSAFI